jgi:multiple sugar transport system substrate-binding protein
MRVRRLAAAAIALVVTSGVASCAGAAGGGSSASGTVQMVLWPGPEGDAMQKVVDAYNAGQGKNDGVSVKMSLLSRTDTFAKEATEMAAKSSSVDVYFTASYIVGQHAPSLDPISGVDTSAYFPVAVNGLTYQGKLYGLPLDVSNHFLLYRKDLMDQLMSDATWKAEYATVSQQVLGKSLTPKPPADWNWDDYLAAAAFFTKKYNPDSPTTYGTALQAKNLLYNVMLWDDVLWSEGGNWLDSSGKPALNSAAGKAAMSVYSTVYTKGLTSPDSAQAEFPETQAAMQSGNAAFALQWSAGYADLNNAQKSPKTAGKMGIAPVPGSPHQTHVHALAVGLNKYSKNKANAMKWLKYLATPDAMTKYAQAGGIPAMPAVLQAQQATNPVFASIASSIGTYGFAEPTLANSFQAYSDLADAISSAWVGREPADSALTKADAALAKLSG